MSTSFNAFFNALARAPARGLDVAAVREILSKRTVIYDQDGKLWLIPAPNDSELPAAVEFLAQQVGAQVKEGQHPVTGDFHALSVSLANCVRPNEVLPLMRLMTQAGCYSFDPQEGQYVRNPIDLEGTVREPRVLPRGHDCIYAPKPPHIFAHLGPILLASEKNGVVAHFGLDGLNTDQVNERRRILNRVEEGYFYDRSKYNPITQNKANMAVGYTHDHPDLPALSALPNCFSQTGVGRWLNGQGTDLATVLIGKIADRVQIKNDDQLLGQQTSVFLPLGNLIGVEQAYLSAFIQSRASSWGANETGSIRTGSHRRTGELLMGIRGNGAKAAELRSFFEAARDNSVIDRPRGAATSDNPFGDLIHGA